MPVHVLCFGNEWQGDDGFGLHVLRRLRNERRLPKHVQIFEAGTAGLNALPQLEGCHKAVLVDGLKTGTKFGSLHRLALNAGAVPCHEPSLHGLGVEGLLAALPLALAHQATPKLVLIGAEIGPIVPFTNALSPALAAAVTGVVDLVVLECNRQT